jgi:hypothetical protein
MCLQTFWRKQPAKSNKGLETTPLKGVQSGKEVIHMVQYDGKMQELIVTAQHASSPAGY